MLSTTCAPPRPPPKPIDKIVLQNPTFAAKKYDNSPSSKKFRDIISKSLNIIDVENKSHGQTSNTKLYRNLDENLEPSTEETSLSSTYLDSIISFSEVIFSQQMR